MIGPSKLLIPLKDIQERKAHLQPSTTKKIHIIILQVYIVHSVNEEALMQPIYIFQNDESTHLGSALMNLIIFPFFERTNHHT